MKLVQIQIRPSVPFWFIQDMVRLNQNNRISEFINVDSLNDEIKKIINLAIYRQEINLLDYNGIKLKSINDVSYVLGDCAITTEDVNDDSEKNLIPELISVTTNDEEEKPEKEKVSMEPSHKHIENAKILLEQNGNTIKKMVKNMKKTNDNLILLSTCLDIENSNKNRKGVIVAIQEAMMEY